jgi:hypothetical protein
MLFKVNDWKEKHTLRENTMERGRSRREGKALLKKYLAPDGEKQKREWN